MKVTGGISHLTPEDSAHRSAVAAVRTALSDEILGGAPALFTRTFVDRMLDMIAADARTVEMVAEAQRIHGVAGPRRPDDDWETGESAEEAVNAMLHAFDTAVQYAGNPAAQRYRYQGPRAASDFCAARLADAAQGVTYTRAEMKSLDNGFGLPAEFFCGGMGCRHRWLATFR